MLKISTTSKLDGIRSWSLQAIDTCPGSIAAPGVLVDACKGCYATTGNYRFANVKAPRESNKLDWQRMDWQFQFSDDQAVWRQGTQAYAALQQMQRQYDPDYSIWNQHAPKGHHHD